MQKSCFKKIAFLGICTILLSVSVGFTAGEAAENESTAVPVPISFKHDKKLMKNMVLIETIDFELSESNAAITYPVPETDSDLFFVFHDVSSSINMSLIVENDSEYCVGFRGKSNTIYVQINPDLKYEFELSLGVIVSDDMKQTEVVDNCSGLLEIYRVVD